MKLKTLSNLKAPEIFPSLIISGLLSEYILNNRTIQVHGAVAGWEKKGFFVIFLCVPVIKLCGPGSGSFLLTA